MMPVHDGQRDCLGHLVRVQFDEPLAGGCEARAVVLMIMRASSSDWTASFQR